MNTWKRLVIISLLALMVLEPATVVTGFEQENITTWIRGGYGAFQRSDLPDMDSSQVRPIVAPTGS